MQGGRLASIEYREYIRLNLICMHTMAHTQTHTQREGRNELGRRAQTGLGQQALLDGERGVGTDQRCLGHDCVGAAAIAAEEESGGSGQRTHCQRQFGASNSSSSSSDG